MNNNMKATLASVFLSILFFIVCCIISYFLFDYFNPPITEEVYRYMPTENIFTSIIISFFITILFYVMIRKYIKRNW